MMRLLCILLVGVVLSGCSGGVDKNYIDYSRDAVEVNSSGKGDVEITDGVGSVGESKSEAGSDKRGTDSAVLGPVVSGDDSGSASVGSEDAAISGDAGTDGSVVVGQDDSEGQDADPDRTIGESFSALTDEAKAMVVRELVCFPDDVQDYTLKYLSEGYLGAGSWKSDLGDAQSNKYRGYVDALDFEAKVLSLGDRGYVLGIRFGDGVRFDYHFRLDDGGNLSYLKSADISLVDVGGYADGFKKFGW